MYATISYKGTELERVSVTTPDEIPRVEGYDVRLFQDEPDQWIDNIERATIDNPYYRRVISTGPNLQVVYMTLQPEEEIGMEVHNDTDQFIRIEKGMGKAILNGVDYALGDGVALHIKQGTHHNIINTSPTDVLHLYTIYSPPHHAKGLVEPTKQE